MFKRKRDRDRAVLKAKLDEETARLAVSVKSIIGDDSVVDKRQMLARTFGQYLAHVNPRASIRDVAKFHAIFAKNTDDGPSDFTDDDDDETRTERLSADADDDQCDEDDRECDDFEKGESIMESQLIGLAKRHGWRTVCENFVKRGIAADLFSESEVTAMLTGVARKMHPELPADQAFAKAYSAQTPDGELMRRTTMAARDAGFLSRTSKLAGSTPAFLAGADDGPRGTPGRATLTPRVTGGRAARAVDNPRSALDQLQALAEAQRAQHTELTEAGAFARVYQDPKNAALVAKERDENRPRATGW